MTPSRLSNWSLTLQGQQGNNREVARRHLGVVLLFEFKQSYDLYKYIHTQIADCETEMDRLLDEYTDGCCTDMQDYTATKKGSLYGQKNALIV